MFIGSETPSKGYQFRHRRGKSETLRAQYINTKDIRLGSQLFMLCTISLEVLITVYMLTEWMRHLFLHRVTIGTWNVAGRLPDEDLQIDDWLCTKEPSDMYIIG